MSCRRPQFANELERATGLTSTESMYFSNGAEEGTD